MTKQRAIKPALRPRSTDNGTGGRNGDPEQHKRTQPHNSPESVFVFKRDDIGFVKGLRSEKAPVSKKNESGLKIEIPKGVPVSVLVIKWPDGYWWSSSVCYN